jgi:hypothetical protein
MSLVHNEQVKLTATALNNVAVGFVVGGFVAPVVGFSQALDVRAGAAPILFSLVWLATGFALHVSARIVLRRLKP